MLCTVKPLNGQKYRTYSSVLDHMCHKIYLISMVIDKIKQLHFSIFFYLYLYLWPTLRSYYYYYYSLLLLLLLLSWHHSAKWSAGELTRSFCSQRHCVISTTLSLTSPSIWICLTGVSRVFPDGVSLRDAIFTRARDTRPLNQWLPGEPESDKRIIYWIGSFSLKGLNQFKNPD